MTASATDIRAPVFDLQSFSLHDGPGIRTTIFFKGCPLSCAWCHNPESQSPRPHLMFHKNLCVGCFLCVEACAHEVHYLLPGGKHGVNHKNCVGCGACLELCCYGALALVGIWYTPEELLEKIKGDIRYFALSGDDDKQKGGITFSGGEPLLYAAFISVFRALIPHIHTAMETSGQGTRESVEEIVDCIDLFLFDIKMTNTGEHKRYCGLDNALILDNLNFLYTKNKNIVLRLPLIPGLNDSEEHFDALAALLQSYPEIERKEIMAYHNLGIGKAEALGLEISREIPPSSAGQETSERWLEALRSRGCTGVYLS
jgi:pyruvate formate lyase activating enzyme